MPAASPAYHLCSDTTPPQVPLICRSSSQSPRKQPCSPVYYVIKEMMKDTDKQPGQETHRRGRGASRRKGLLSPRSGVCHLPAWMCLLTWTPCSLGWDGVEASSCGPDHWSQMAPSLLQGSSEALVLAWSSQQPDPPRSHPESPHHHVGIYEGFRIPMSGAGAGRWGAGGAETNMHAFCHCTPGWPQAAYC